MVFVDHTNSGNYWTSMPFGQWRNIATSVKDGTRFKIRVQVDFNQAAGIQAEADFSRMPGSARRSYLSRPRWDTFLR